MRLTPSNNPEVFHVWLDIHEKDRKILRMMDEKKMVLVLTSDLPEEDEELSCAHMRLEPMKIG